jgi:predicted RNase H-like HicB family nuclease
MTPKTLDYYLSLPYPIVLIPYQEDGAWYARIPLLTGCMADGATPAQALAALEEVKRLWFEASLKHGHTIPEPEPLDIATLELRQRGDVEPA